MAEPPLKKQKLTREWFLKQLQDVELNEDWKKSVAEYLSSSHSFSEDLPTASFEALMTLLDEIIPDKTNRKIVVLRLCRVFQSASPSAPAPRTQSFFCSFHPIKCFFGVGRLFVEIGDCFSVVVSVFNNIFHIPDWLRLFQSQTPLTAFATGWTRQWRRRQSQAGGKLMKCRGFPTTFWVMRLCKTS